MPLKRGWPSGKMQLFLLLLAFLLCPRIETDGCNGRCQAPVSLVPTIPPAVSDSVRNQRLIGSCSFMQLRHLLGTHFVSGSNRIIGGHEAMPHSRPYMAFIRIKTREMWKECGGFLVHKDFVLTAAHCKGTSMYVILGAHDISKKERSQQVIPVRRAIPHPDYNPQTFSSDIMLLQLKSQASLNDKVKPLKLPTSRHQVTPGMVCSVAGWGHISMKEDTTKLHEVDLEIQEDQMCRSLYEYDPAIQICGGDPKQRKASFTGDSGGPLVCNNVAQGIVSFGKVTRSSPCVYTRISSFLLWIKNTMR